jgi:hypothetical protein
MSPDFRVRVFRRPRKVQCACVPDTWGDAAGYMEGGLAALAFVYPAAAAHRCYKRWFPRGWGVVVSRGVGEGGWASEPLDLAALSGSTDTGFKPDGKSHHELDYHGGTLTKR